MRVCVCVRVCVRDGRTQALSSECKIVSQFFIQGEGKEKVT